MKRIVSLLFIIAILCSFGSVSFASSVDGQQTFSTRTLDGQGYVPQDHAGFSNDPNQRFTDEEARAISNPGIPSVSSEQASSWIERKGFEIVGVLQTLVQPFAVIIFIGCALMALVGAFGNGSLVGKGLMGMMIACIMYAVALYAPEILDFFMEWVRT